MLEELICSCLNGGGQTKPNSGLSPNELSQLLESKYMENREMESFRAECKQVCDSSVSWESGTNNSAVIIGELDHGHIRCFGLA
ncbi:hypothetical protein JHK86_043453 [Glycine max]|nr:hypothetical protein JHK86_043453 [Glycine max]